jgi:N-acetylneuraminic acid mutarotase
MHAAIWLVAGLLINVSQSYGQLGHAQSNNWFEITKTPVTCFGSSVNEIDGNIYMIGGELSPPNTRMGISSVRIYDIEADEWTAGTDMPTARPLVPNLKIGNKIYAIGGYRHNSVTWNRVEVYDVSTDTWTRLADLPTPRFWSTGCVYDGKIYIMGGITQSALENDPEPKGLDIVERYDPVTNTWDTCATMITGRLLSTSCVLNDSIYVIGGVKEKAGDWPAVNTVEVYDPYTDTWVQKGDMHITRSELTNVVLDGKIYAIGGFPDPYGRTVRFSFEVYDPNSNTWILHNDPDDLHPQGAPYHAIHVDDRIYALNAVGPYVDYHPVFPEVYVYNKPIFQVKSNPMIAIEDSIIAEVLQPCILYIVPPGTPPQLDSIVEDTIISFNVPAIGEHRFAIGDLPSGPYLTYAVASDGQLDLNYFQFRIMEYIPDVLVQVIDEYTKEILSDCQVYLNGKPFEKRFDDALNLTGWAYDTCNIRITKDHFNDLDTTVVINSDTTLVMGLQHLYHPEFHIYSEPLLEKTDLLKMMMTQHGWIYVTPEGTSAVSDSITKYAVKSKNFSAGITDAIPLFDLPPGIYRVFGISLGGRVATESYAVQLIDHFPECIIQVRDSLSGEILNSCLLVLDGNDTIPGNLGEFDLSGLVYDTCFIEVTKEGYHDFDNMLVVLSDTSYTIDLVPMIVESITGSSAQEILIYPNPTQGMITVQTGEQRICSIEIINLIGRVVNKMEFTDSVAQVDLSPLPTGIYIIRIISGEKVFEGRVAKY